MKKLTLSAIALSIATMIGSTASQADVLNPALVWTNQANAQFLIGCGPGIGAGCVDKFADGTLIPAAGSQISFNDTSLNTITGFGNSVIGSGPPWTASSAALDAMQLQNNIPAGSAASRGTIFEFTGTINLAADDVLAITHDDGAVLSLDGPAGDLVIQQRAATSAQTGTFTNNGSGGFPVFSGPTTFTLFYGECCSLPAVLEFTINGVQVTNTPVPEPASLALLGSALLGFGVMRRRRKTS